MAGQVSIPVQNSSGRAVAIAGVAALLIALSQWAQWAGVTNWDLFSLVSGFAQSAQLRTGNAEGAPGFNCPNQSLGAQAAMMSDDLLKTVGHELCRKDVAQAQMLRGTDTFYVEQTAFRQRVTRRPAQKLNSRGQVFNEEPQAKSVLVAAIEPGRIDTNRDLLDEIDSRARKLEAIDLPDDSDGPGTGGGDDRDDIEVGEDDHSGHGGGDGDDDNSGSGGGDDDGDHSGDSDDNDGEGSHGGDDDGDNSGSGSGDDGHETAEDDHDSSGSGGDDGDHSGSGGGGDRDDGDDDNSGGGNSGSGHS